VPPRELAVQTGHFAPAPPHAYVAVATIFQTSIFNLALLFFLVPANYSVHCPIFSGPVPISSSQKLSPAAMFDFLV